jgi:HEAT repeat protein
MTVQDLLKQASEITAKDPRAKGDELEIVGRGLAAHGDAALPELLEAMKSSNSLISQAAGVALNRMTTDATFEAVNNLLQSADGNREQTFALNWIQQHPRPESVLLLKEIYDRNPHVSVKNKIVIVVGQMDYPQALAFLGEVLQGYVTQDYEGISQSITAFNTLKKHEGQEDIKALLDDYRKKSPRYLSQLIDYPGLGPAIEGALIEIGTTEALTELVDYVNNIEVVSSKELSQKENLIRSLKRVQSPPSFVTDAINHHEENLLRYLITIVDTQQYQYAVSQLLSKNTDEAFDVLIERLQVTELPWHTKRQQYIAQQLKRYKGNPKVAEALEKYQASLGN